MNWVFRNETRIRRNEQNMYPDDLRWLCKIDGENAVALAKKRARAATTFMTTGSNREGNREYARENERS